MAAVDIQRLPDLLCPSMSPEEAITLALPDVIPEPEKWRLADRIIVAMMSVGWDIVPEPDALEFLGGGF